MTNTERTTSERLDLLACRFEMLKERLDSGEADAADVLQSLYLASEYAVQDAMRSAVADMRAQGASWATVGEALSISRQAAQQRFGSEGNTK